MTLEQINKRLDLFLYFQAMQIRAIDITNCSNLNKRKFSFDAWLMDNRYYDLVIIENYVALVGGIINAVKYDGMNFNYSPDAIMPVEEVLKKFNETGYMFVNSERGQSDILYSPNWIF